MGYCKKTFRTRGDRFGTYTQAVGILSQQPRQAPQGDQYDKGYGLSRQWEREVKAQCAKVTRRTFSNQLDLGPIRIPCQQQAPAKNNNNYVVATAHIPAVEFLKCLVFTD